MSKKCEFCGKVLRTLAGLKSHCVQKHAAEMDRDQDLMEAAAEDCMRDMYGADYDYLKYSGWLDSR